MRGLKINTQKLAHDEMTTTRRWEWKRLWRCRQRRRWWWERPWWERWNITRMRKESERHRGRHALPYSENKRWMYLAYIHVRICIYENFQSLTINIYICIYTVLRMSKPLDVMCVCVCVYVTSLFPGFLHPLLFGMSSWRLFRTLELNNCRIWIFIFRIYSTQW